MPAHAGGVLALLVAIVLHVQGVAVWLAPADDPVLTVLPDLMARCGWVEVSSALDVCWAR